MTGRCCRSGFHGKSRRDDDDIQHLVYRSDVSTRGLKRPLKFHHIGHFLVDGHTRNGILLLFKQLQNDSLIFKSRFNCRYFLGQFGNSGPIKFAKSDISQISCSELSSSAKANTSELSPVEPDHWSYAKWWHSNLDPKRFQSGFLGRIASVGKEVGISRSCTRIVEPVWLINQLGGKQIQRIAIFLNRSITGCHQSVDTLPSIRAWTPAFSNVNCGKPGTESSKFILSKTPLSNKLTEPFTVGMDTAI